MRFTTKIQLTAFFILLFSFSSIAQSTKYKCMLQLTNYKGLEAYVVVSLIDAKGNYEKTMYVMGDDKQWYNGFKEWHKSMSKKNEKLNAVTGASVAAGDRSIATFTIDESKMNKGYKLRFETAVEDQEYYSTDAEIPLTTDAITQKTAGKGYIRYVKLNKAQ